MSGFWNYRITKRALPSHRSHEPEVEFVVRQCHYDEGDDPEGIPAGWTIDPVFPIASSKEELRQRWVEALSRPVVDLDRLKNA